MKGNEYRKYYYIDRFARHFYCIHARINQLRSDKKNSRRMIRRIYKKSLEDELSLLLQ